MWIIRAGCLADAINATVLRRLHMGTRTGAKTGDRRLGEPVLAMASGRAGRCSTKPTQLLGPNPQEPAMLSHPR